MARGSEGKQRRKAERKEAREETAKSDEPGRDVFEEVLKKDGLVEEGQDAAVAAVDESSDDDDSSDDDSYESSEDEKEDILKKAMKKSSKSTTKKSRNAKSSCGSSSPCCPPKPSGKGIKTLPLIFLLMLTGTTVLPVLIYMGDYIGKYSQKNHIMGSIGYKFGMGATPKRRVVSFYEKHDATKVEDVPKMMSKYYGDYPKLIKRLERKYNDYGYFLHWKEDEAPSKLAKEQLWKTYDIIIKYIDDKFIEYAPKWMKSRVRNVKYNLKYLVRKGKKFWRKTAWPLLEPIFGVPKGGASQKRKDRNNAQKARGRGKYAFRDEEDDLGDFTSDEM